MGNPSREGGDHRHRRKKRRVSVSKPDEDGMSARQIAVLAVLGVLVVAAVVYVLSGFETPALRRR